MQMTDVRNKLQQLQKVLSEKYQIEKEINEAPKQLNTLEGLLERLRKEYLEKNTIYEENKEKVSALEVELREAEKLREDGEKGMDNITSHREYEALDKQISEAKAKEEEIRKELDKQKKTLSELNEELKTSETMIKAQEDELNSSKTSIDKQMNKYKSQLEKLSKKEEDATEGINSEIVYKFQRIIQRNSEGIVAVKNGVCEGCHTILPAQFANEVREGDEILFCPYCSRILFYEETDENEENFFAMNETGSLSDFDDDDKVNDDENEGYSSEDEYEKDSDYDEENLDDEENQDEESEEEADENN